MRSLSTSVLGEGNFFLELQDHGLPEQRRLNEQLIRLAPQMGIPLVATNDLHYVRRAQSDAHDVLLCVGTATNLDTPGRMRFESSEFYLKSAGEMAALFTDHPQALASTLKIAEMCDFKLEGTSSLPAFDVPAGFTIDSYFEKVAREGYAERLRVLESLTSAGRLRHGLDEYAARLEKEIGVIRRVGFSGYGS